MDQLGLPLKVSRRVAGDALKGAGRGARAATVLAAIKYRNEEALKTSLTPPESGSRNRGTTSPLKVVPEGSEPHQCKPSNPQVDGGSHDFGTAGNHPPSQVVPGSPPLKGEPGPDQAGTDNTEELF
jgi:hypothetical protein